MVSVRLWRLVPAVAAAVVAGLPGPGTAASVKPQIDGVVSVSGAADLAGALDAVPRLRAPVLYLAGKYDTQFADDAGRLYEATGSSDKTLKIVPRGEHGTELVASSPAV